MITISNRKASKSIVDFEVTKATAQSITVKARFNESLLMQPNKPSLTASINATIIDLHNFI